MLHGGPPLNDDERNELREAAYRHCLTAEHAPLIERLADECDDDNLATAAGVIRALLRLAWLT